MLFAGIGTLINVGMILLGSLVGLLLGQRLPPRISETMLQVMGLLVIGIGVQMSLAAETAAQAVVILLALVTGALIGESIDIEKHLRHAGEWIEDQVHRYWGPSPITQAFMTATIVYLVGPLAILGSLQDGLENDPSLLVIKAALDGIASVAFTTSLGIGVIFSAGPVLVYQGTITLLGQSLSALLNEDIIAALTASGGILIMGVGINLLNIKPMRVGNLLPALPLAMALCGLTPIWHL
ncbi:MAG: DUF554 domain-containing protein [Synechococcaceae cyanobacterium SM2_3_1]|nr:DUF554 domain-containing protein [Synechococcaceae cyanobacterium SM2_3_1]